MCARPYEQYWWGHVEFVTSCADDWVRVREDLCYIEDACLSAIWRDMACVAFMFHFCCFACSVCVMFGSMEMFGPQWSVGFMCYIFVLSRTFVLSFVFISLV